MRKIETQEQLEKKKKRNQLILGVIMIFLLTSSIAGYSIMSRESNESTSSVVEQGIEFYRQDNMWNIVIADEVFSFQNLPSEVESVEINGTFILGQYSSKPLYFININEGTMEILNNIGRYAFRYQEACFVNETCLGDFPSKDCSENLIIFKSGNSTKVYQEENCVFIEGDSLKGADAFLYKILGITTN